MGLGFVRRVPLERLTYTSLRKKIQAKAIVTKWVAAAPALRASWLSLNLTQESLTEVTAAAAAATTRTIGQPTASATNGTHAVPVPPPSSSSTTRRNEPPSASVIQAQDSSSGTKLDGVTGCTHKGLALTTPGLFQLATSQRCIASAEMASISRPKTTSAAAPWWKRHPVYNRS